MIVLDFIVRAGFGLCTAVGMAILLVWGAVAVYELSDPPKPRKKR